MASQPVGPWSKLVSAATLGTARSAPPAQAVWPPGVSPLPAQSPETTLLRAALTSYLWQVAGSRTAPGAKPAGATPPPPERPLVSEAAAWRLARLLTGVNRQLVPEWLALAEKARRVLPAHWLPTALEALTDEERDRFASVLGRQAVWLAGLNPKWMLCPSDAQPSEARWTDGTLEERRAELLRMRMQDPDRGRAWLEQTWPTDSPEARAELARVLLSGLSLKDEEFLERALDDKRKEVRAVAAECLTRLPGSGHAKRNRERLEALIVRAGKHSRRKLSLAIETPASLNPLAVRDGIETKRPSGMQLGERAYWLWQMVARAPPQHWTERFDCEAGPFLDAIEATDYGTELLGAFTAAARVHPHIEWTRALCQRWLAMDGEVHGRNAALAGLVASLAAEHHEELLKQVLRRGGGYDCGLLLALLNAQEIAWSAPATALAMTGLTQVTESQAWILRNVLQSWAPRADLDAASTALAEMRAQLTDDSSWHKNIEGMAEILDFRAAMRKELLE
jgi:hypothetical protein